MHSIPLVILNSDAVMSYELRLVMIVELSVIKESRDWVGTSACSGIV